MTAVPRLIMFDWGGTLVHVTRQQDTFAPGVAGLVRVLKDRGIHVLPEAADNLHHLLILERSRSEVVENLTELDDTALLQCWAADEGVTLPAGALDELRHALWSPWVGCLDPMGNVAGTLSRLRAAGIALGLVSNCATMPHYCRVELARQGLADRLVFSLFSSELGVRKPHPRVYDVALERARASLVVAGNGRLDPGDVLFVGDTPRADVDGPAGCGMRTALVRTGNWDGNVDALGRKPDLIVDSIHELPALWT